MLNLAVLFLSLALVSISIASIYLTSHGLKLMDREHPSGHYVWYRGPWWDIDTKPQNMLRFENTNEAVILTTGAISCIAGVVGVVAFFVTLKVSISAPTYSDHRNLRHASINYIDVLIHTLQPFKSTAISTSRLFLLLPATLTFLMSLVGLIYTTVIFKSDHRGQCYWEKGYNPNNVFTCTRELAACNIVSYFVNGTYNLALRQVCGETQTGRHLVAPLFVASTLLFGVSIAKVVLGRKEGVVGETADERVERLQRDSE
jgi:hypothetical protein